MSRTQTRAALITSEAFVAVTAVAGGLALIVGGEGGRFPLSWLADTPFTDYTWPGLILAAAVGGTAAAAAIALVRRLAIAPLASFVAGLILTGWIFGELVVINDHELVSPTEALYLAVGILTTALALRLRRTTITEGSDGAQQAAQTVAPGRYRSNR